GATLAVKAGSGNVGIGTTSPLWKLDVNGEIRARDQLLASNNDGAISLTPSLTYSTINAQRNFPGVQPADLLLATNGGNVGIGTTSPDERMHIVGNTIIEAEAGAGFGAPLRVVKEGTGRQIAAFFSNPRDGASEVEIQMGMGTMLPSAWSLKAASGLFSIANIAVFPPALNIRNTGEIGIGTTSPQGKLDVNGSIYQRGSQLHADYVFEPDYKLETIDEHSEFMWQNKHLPAIPEAKVDEKGNEIIEVGAHRKGIVEELEKAHIYIEQLHKRIKTLEEKLAELEKGLNTVR
ncbi:MAG: hypothetical protein ACETVZ_08550, partial [Phycisphaerae bacterium]